MASSATRRKPQNFQVRSARLPRSAGAGPEAASDVLASVDVSGMEAIVGYMVRRVQLSVWQDFGARFAEHGITPAKYSVVRLVGDNPGITPAGLAEALGVERSRMAVLIDDLERQGLLIRIASTVDRRSRAIFLTEFGQTQLPIYNRLVAASERQMRKRLRGDDPSVLMRMLRNLATPA